MLEFTWSSFAFAVVNFLILAGLLYRLLSKPLVNVLEKRRKDLAATRKAAEDELTKAQELEAEYNAKLRAAEEECHRRATEAREHTETASRERMDKARAEAEQEGQRLKEAFTQERRDALAELKGEIVSSAVGIARRVIAEAAGPDLDVRLVTQLTEKIRALETEGAAGTAGNTGVPVRVVSAAPLDDGVREALEREIQGVSGAAVQVRFETDAELVAGARVEFPTVTVDASLADALTQVQAQAIETSGEEPGRPDRVEDAAVHRATGESKDDA